MERLKTVLSSDFGNEIDIQVTYDQLRKDGSLLQANCINSYKVIRNAQKGYTIYPSWDSRLRTSDDN